MNDLRRYLTVQELQNRRGAGTPAVNSKLLDKAQRQIDSAIAVRIEGANAKSLVFPLIVKKALFNENICTITSSQLTGYYTRGTLEVLEGSFAGSRIFINSSIRVANTNNILFDTVTGLTGELDVKIYQYPKFPRKQDTQLVENVYQKTIPEFLKEAVELQYDYLERTNKRANQFNVKSYSVARDSYSETFGDERTSAIDRINPEALDILDSYGLTTQSL